MRGPTALKASMVSHQRPKTPTNNLYLQPYALLLSPLVLTNLVTPYPRPICTRKQTYQRLSAERALCRHQTRQQPMSSAYSQKQVVSIIKLSIDPTRRSPRRVSMSLMTCPSVYVG